MKTKREKKYTPKPAKRESEPQPFSETLALIWNAKKKLRKK
ncbi:MAG TPA: hypothetical protein VGR64_02260 [Terracidiphilus sp.]|nr:hypothetical protein [Terracidiphilus sp.]